VNPSQIKPNTTYLTATCTRWRVRDIFRASSGRVVEFSDQSPKRKQMALKAFASLVVEQAPASTIVQLAS
jgi:hypothetical protein